MENAVLWETWANVLQAIATTMAIFAAGVWSYMLFVRQRQRFPRAEVSHHVWCADLPYGRKLLRIRVRVENIGSVLVRLVDGFIQVQQIYPIPAQIVRDIAQRVDPVPDGCFEADWPEVGRRDCDWTEEPHEIEPSEFDEFHFDFVIAGEVLRVQIYSHFRNVLKGTRRIGWNHTSVVELEMSRVAKIGKGVKNAEGKQGRRGKANKGTGASQEGR